MNVIISNLNGNKFVNLDIDIIKKITGEFTVDEVIQSFSNFFFNRMLLDVTAIKDYTNVNIFKNLSIGLDVNKIILFLSEDVANSESYISKLINFGIYNFAKTEEELKYLYDNPNSYRDVAHLQKNDEIIISNVSDNQSNLINFEDKANYSNVPRVIGFKNFTSHAGATSLIYMLKRELSKNYYTVAIEINKRDFMFFNDNDMISCRASEFKNMLLKYKNSNIILVDLNDLDIVLYKECSDIIYLMESSILMINKLYMLNNQCFSKISSEKVILNKSLLSDKDIRQFEFESNINFFGVLPPMNDRIDNSKILFPILEKLDLYQKIN